MKTFLYSIPNKIQAFSKKLDVKAALCGNSWEVFNDEGVKQLFIFNEDETILITNNGKVLNAKWKFVPQNSSILITTDEEALMFRPAFFNKDIFALKQDGVERYLFLIDEVKKPDFHDLSLAFLTTYIDKEIAASPKRSEEARKEQIQNAQKEKKQEEREWIVVFLKEHKTVIRHKLARKKKIGRLGVVVCSACILFSLAFLTKYPSLIVSVIVFVFLLLYFLTLIFSGPSDVFPEISLKKVRYHTEEEILKMYEEL